MSEPFQEIAGLNKLIHEPARLAIVSALSACQAADFMFLQRLTGLSKGNLSTHLSKLEAGGIVEIHKEFVGKLPRTVVNLTETGRRSAEAYWDQLERLKREAVTWRPETVTTA
jgi:DNA-binding transcriptional ArsR family regulator